MTDVRADQAAERTDDQTVVLRPRRDTGVVATVDRRDFASSLADEEKVGLGERQRDLGDERELELRDLSADDDFGRRSEVRDVDYDYIFGNDDNDDLVTIIIIIRMAFVSPII